MGNEDNFVQFEKEENSSFKESLCEITSKSGEKIIGFFGMIPFGLNIPVLITSNKILNNGDFISENNILIYLKNKDRYFSMKFDDTRKYYSSKVHPLLIAEIKPEDNISFISFLEIDSYKNQNEIKVIYYGDKSKKEYYYFGNIVNTNNNNSFHFNLSYNNIPLGCPILNSKNNKVIGINNTLKGSHSKTGIFIYEEIYEFCKKFYISYKFKINIYFYDMDKNKEYSIYIKSIDIMFGELIVYFYLISGLEFHDNFLFYYNNLVVPSYSTTNLQNLNIQNNSKIFFRRNTQINPFEIKLNIIFNISNGNNIIVVANPNMTVKELILKFSQVYKRLYHHLLQKYKIMFCSLELKPTDENILNIGLNNGSYIKVVRLNQLSG